MEWEIETEKGKINLTSFEVLNLLMGKVIDKERSDQEDLSRTLVEYLQNNSALTDISLMQLASMAFEIGYFYRIFKTKNKVSITETDGEGNDNQSESEPTS